MMKNTKSYLIFLLAGTVTFTVGLWLYSTMDTLGPFEYAAAATVLILVAFGALIGYRRLQNEKKGLTVEDEMSRLIKQKAAASAYVYSIYLWTMIILFTTDTTLEIHIPIGIGILGMGVLFAGFWVYYSNKGIEDADPY